MLIDFCPLLETDTHQPDLFETATATFSPGRRYRYALTRVWDPDRPLAAFIMLNPSTADAFILDPTVTRCRARAKRWGAGGVLVLNAFALRATDPRALCRNEAAVGRDNDAVIAWHFSTDGPDMVGPVVVAWGSDRTLITTGRDRAVLDLLRARGVRPQCLGVTKDGYPRHPLYVAMNAPAMDYEAPEPRGR